MCQLQHTKDGAQNQNEATHQDGTKKRNGNAAEKKQTPERFHSNRLSSPLLDPNPPTTLHHNPATLPHCFSLPNPICFLSSQHIARILQFRTENRIQKGGEKKGRKKTISIDGSMGEDRRWTMERRSVNGKTDVGLMMGGGDDKDGFDIDGPLISILDSVPLIFV